jgi:hypothetical protein
VTEFDIVFVMWTNVIGNDPCQIRTSNNDIDLKTRMTW